MQPQQLTNTQRSEDWFEARLGRATASRFGDIMATGYNGKPLAGYKNYRAELVIERLTGQRADFFQSSAMLWGTETEPLARLYYQMSSNNAVEECGFFAHPTLQAGASPDGLIGTDGSLEIKCPNTATHIETLHSGEIPKMYYWQVQGQLWVTGRAWADFVSFDPRMPDNARMVIIRVERSQEDIKRLEASITAFLKSVDDECEFIKNYGKVKQVIKTTEPVNT